jgi:hypothetical protein
MERLRHALGMSGEAHPMLTDEDTRKAVEDRLTRQKISLAKVDAAVNAQRASAGKAHR